MAELAYFEPTSVAEAVSLLGRYRAEARVLAGGTDLLVQMKQGKTSLRCLIDLATIPGLDNIEYNATTGLKLGARVTIRALERSTLLQEKYPVIAQAAGRLGHIAIRNIATLGGNLCHAVPSAEMAPALVALSARARIAGPDGERTVPLEEFFVAAGRTVLKPTELLVEIQVPVSPTNTRGVYLKYTARATGLPIVGVAVVATVEPKSRTCQDIRIVVSNVAPTVMRARQAEAIIRGKPISPELIEQSARAAAGEANPRPGSVRASAEYKKAMAGVFTRRALTAIIS